MLAAVIGLAVVAALGFSIASVRGSGEGDVRACVQSRSGNLRIIGTAEACRSGETFLALARGGGEAGAGGGQLLEAAAGDCAVATTDTVCVQRTLPAGSWEVRYRAHRSEEATFSRSTWACSLTVGATVLESEGSTRLQYSIPFQLDGSIELAEPDTVTVTCSSTGVYSLLNQRLSALAVGSIAAWE
jgi:hypothetical protein